MADKPQHPPTIDLDQVRLRRLRTADAAALYAYLRDPVVTDMKTTIAAFVFTLCVASSLIAEEPAFRLTVSGALSSKLAPDTRLQIWCAWVDPSNWMTVALNDLPVDLPFEKFRDRYWQVSFFSKRGGDFSVSLSADLFDRPRLINIPLNAPQPQIRPVFGVLSDVRYTANITKRIQYYDLPRWDEAKGRFAPSSPPVLNITRVQDGSQIYLGKMGVRCGASKWFASLGKETELKDGEVYRMLVSYDSGGLFPTMHTTYDFTYHASLHAR